MNYGSNIKKEKNTFPIILDTELVKIKQKTDRFSIEKDWILTEEINYFSRSHRTSIQKSYCFLKNSNSNIRNDILIKKNKNSLIKNLLVYNKERVSKQIILIKNPYFLIFMDFQKRK